MQEKNENIMRAINGKIAQFKSGEVGIIKKSKKSTFFEIFFLQLHISVTMVCDTTFKKNRKTLSFLAFERQTPMWFLP